MENWKEIIKANVDTQRMQVQAAELAHTFMHLQDFIEVDWERKTGELSGAPKDLWGVLMWSMSFGLSNKKLWLWWPLSALKIYECVIPEKVLKISSKSSVCPLYAL